MLFQISVIKNVKNNLDPEARYSVTSCKKASKKPWKKGKKNPGIELLSHTLMCSTIVARLLIDRVRDGNVSFKPAIDTGKKYVIKIVVLLLRSEKKQNNR